MSKIKDRKRAEQGVIHRSGTEIQRTQYMCPFPGCGKIFFKEEGALNMCPYHRQFLVDMAFALSNFIKMKPPEVSETDILIPKPGMGIQAIKEAVAKERGKHGIKS